MEPGKLRNLRIFCLENVAENVFPLPSLFFKGSVQVVFQAENLNSTPMSLENGAWKIADFHKFAENVPGKS